MSFKLWASCLGPGIGHLPAYNPGMTSTVLARKYRPRSFDTMVGQGHVVQALSNALTHQRLHHAYMFTGTRGVGKTTVSRILAKSLNCVGPDGQGGITAQPCGQCQPCRDIDSGRFVDYVELDAASNRGVDEISQLLDQSVYKPVVGRFKVYMIDEVHMLSNTAFNAMLKTLEEPPDYLKFVLATTDPQKVPVTVLSRCLQFNLRPMAIQTVQTHLQDVLTQEAVPFETGALRLLARAARGSMRDGLSLTDQAIAFGAGNLQESVVRQMLGAVDRQHVQRILSAVAQSRGADLVAAVDTLREMGLSAQGTLDELAAALQHMALIQTVPGLSDDDADAMVWQELAHQLAADETQLFYSLALQGRAELALAPDEYAGLLMILLRWLAFKPGGQVAVPPQEPGRPKATGPTPTEAVGPGAATRTPGLARAPVPAEAPALVDTPPARPPSPVVHAAPVPVPAAAPVVAAAIPPAVGAALPRANTPSPRPLVPEPDLGPEPPPWDDEPAPSSAEMEMAAMSESDRRLAPEPEADREPVREGIVPREVPVVPRTELGDRWNDVVKQLVERGLIAALVRELALQSECVSVKDDNGRSVWHLRVERENLRTDAQRDRLTQAMNKLLGGDVELLIEAGIGRDTPALRDQAERASRQAAAEVLIRQDPMVDGLLTHFPGSRIVAGSITPI